MRLNHKIKIDLFEVLRTGKFDFVTIGKSKEWILQNFVDPDARMDIESKGEANYWIYGRIEFYFEQEILVEISMKDVRSLDGGQNLEIDDWIFNENDGQTVKSVIEQIVKNRIEFQVKHHVSEYNCQTSIGLLQAGAHLVFNPDEPEVIDYNKWMKEDSKLIDPNLHKLSSISLVERERIKTVYNNGFHE